MKNFSRYFHKSLFYRKSLQIILLASILPTIIIAIGSYYIGTWQIEKEVERNQKLQIQQIDRRISEQFNMLEQVVVKWSFNAAFTKVLQSQDINKDYANVAELYNALTLMKNSHSLIGDVYMYIRDRNIFISESAGVVKLDVEQQQEISGLTESQKDFYYEDIRDSSVFDEVQATRTLFICKVHTLSSFENASIVISLNRKSVDALLNQLVTGKEGISFIVYSNGSAYMPVNENSEKKEQIKEQICREIAKRDAISNVFLQKFSGEIYSISYGTYVRSGWKYVEAMPLSKMLEPVKVVSRLLILMSLFTFSFIVIASLFLTRRIYKPVEQLTGFLTERIGGTDGNGLKDEFGFIRQNVLKINLEHLELRAYMEKNKVILRDSFLLQLVQGNLNYYTEPELRETMKRMGWELGAPGFVVAFLKIFIPINNEAKFNHGDEQLATYAAVNIIEETLANDARVLGVINFHNLSAALILSSEDQVMNIAQNPYDELFQLILQRLSGYLEMQVVIGVSKRTEKLRDIASAYNEALQSIRYRDVNHKSEIIFAEDLVQEALHVVKYPVDLENEIIHDIKTGIGEDLEAKVWRFKDELKKTSGKEFFIQQGMLHLLGGVLHAMIQSGVDIHALYSDKNLYEQMGRIKEPDEMAAWLWALVLEPFLKENQRSQETKYKKMVDSVMEYIHNNYVKDISLDICADEFCISARRLSVLFYKVTGMYFQDYVIDFRLKKAKELLKDTDENVIDIAFSVGYQPQYFNKIFKKKEGITPGEFRKQNR